MVYIPRTLEKCLLKASQKFSVVQISGMRQSGKTTLLKKNSEHRAIVTLYDYHALETARERRNLFFKQYTPPIFIDEIECASELVLEIKAFVDREEKPGMVWLATSQPHSLIQRAGESLAGRLARFELLPLSLYEHQKKAFEQEPYLPQLDAQRHKLSWRDDDVLWNIVWRGGLPELYDEDSEATDNDKRHWFFNRLLRRYLENDVREINGVVKINNFWRFLVVLAQYIGEEVQIGKIAYDAGISASTAKTWLTVAQDGGVIWFLPAFYENVGKALVKKPRLYFSDTGLASWLLGISSPNNLKDTRLGEVFFKNFVLNELRKSWVHNGRDANFYFYRDITFRNIDLVIKSGGQYFPVMIKAMRAPTESMVSSFDCLKGRRFSCGPGALICMTQEQRFLKENVIAHSIWDI